MLDRVLKKSKGLDRQKQGPDMNLQDFRDVESDLDGTGDLHLDGQLVDLLERVRARAQHKQQWLATARVVVARPVERNGFFCSLHFVQVK